MAATFRAMLSVARPARTARPPVVGSLAGCPVSRSCALPSWNTRTANHANVAAAAAAGYTTFSAATDEAKPGVVTVTFDHPPVNLQDQSMIDDLNALADSMENDSTAKVVVFQSAHPEIFVAHLDTWISHPMKPERVDREQVELLELQSTLERVSKLPQATIAKVEGFARGGGHEFMLACDMRFASRTKARFMQMEVAVGIVPCGGGTARMARQVGLGRAMELLLSAKDWDADKAEKYGTINLALDDDEIGPYVDALAERIAKWPAGSINAVKQGAYASIDLPIAEALKEEAYRFREAAYTTPALARFRAFNESNLANTMEHQRNWDNAVLELQDMKVEAHN